MPYSIEKRGNQWVKVKKSTGEVVSHHTTKGKAQMSAYFAEHGEGDGHKKKRR